MRLRSPVTTPLFFEKDAGFKDMDAADVPLEEPRRSADDDPRGAAEDPRGGGSGVDCVKAMS